MSYAFDARFSSTDLELPEILDRLAVCLHESRIDFDGEIMRLSSRDGVPTVMSMATKAVASLEDVASAARSWWGVSLYCISRPLAEALGRTDAIEVYLRIFKTKTGRMIVYNEASGAFGARTESEELTADLGALLAGICGRLELDAAIYAEEDGAARTADLAEVEGRLRDQAAAAQALRWLGVVTETSMPLRRARELAGAWADRIRVSVTGHLVLPFLGGQLG